MSDNDIFREIDQDIAQDRMIQFWKKNQKLILNLIIAILILAGGYGAWVTWNQHQQEKDGLDFAHALELAKEGKSLETEAALAELKQKGSEGYALLARLKEASIKTNSDKPKAIELYDSLSKDTKIDPLFKDYAQLMLVYLQMDTLDGPSLEKMIEPLLHEKSSWRFSALELAALAAQKSNNTEKAKTYLTAIVEDAQSPHAIRARAGEILTQFDK